MTINDFHVELATAIPEEDIKISSGGKGNTIINDIQTDHGRKSAYIKILRTDEIAKEALCAVLAKLLYLPITQPYYVNISNIEHLLNLKNIETNIEKVGFGLGRSITAPTFQFSSSAVEEALLKWPDLLRCAVFDEWIGNRDRTYKNIAFEKHGQLWIYDHDDALPGYLSPSTPVTPQLLELAARGKSEFELYRIRDDAMGIVEDYKNLDWQKVYEFVLPEQLANGKACLRKYMQLLRERIPYMRGILTQDLRIKQKEFPLTDVGQRNSENRKK